MGDAKRRRDAEPADPLAAARARLDAACRDLGLMTAEAGVAPTAMLDLLYRHIILILAAARPQAQGDAAAAAVAEAIGRDVTRAREVIQAATRAKEGQRE